jgi:hypothetical protein
MAEVAPGDDLLSAGNIGRRLLNAPAPITFLFIAATDDVRRLFSFSPLGVFGLPSWAATVPAAHSPPDVAAKLLRANHEDFS